MQANSFLNKVSDQFASSNLNADYPGYYLGMLREESGVMYRLARAGATITAAKACKADTTATGSALGHTVIPTAAANEGVAGVAEIAVTNGNYFWMTVGRISNCLVQGTVTAGDRLITSSTSGALSTYGAAAVAHVAAIALAANASGAGTIKVQLLVGY